MIHVASAASGRLMMLQYMSRGLNWISRSGKTSFLKILAGSRHLFSYFCHTQEHIHITSNQAKHKHHKQYNIMNEMNEQVNQTENDSKTDSKSDSKTETKLRNEIEIVTSDEFHTCSVKRRRRRPCMQRIRSSGGGFKKNRNSGG